MIRIANKPHNIPLCPNLSFVYLCVPLALGVSTFPSFAAIYNDELFFCYLFSRYTFV